MGRHQDLLDSYAKTYDEEVRALSVWDSQTIPERFDNLRATHKAAVQSFLRVRGLHPHDEDRVENLWREMVTYKLLLDAIKFAGANI